MAAFLRVLLLAPLVIVRSANTLLRIMVLAIITFFFGVSLLLVLDGLLLSDRDLVVTGVWSVLIFIVFYVLAVGAFAVADERDFKRSRTDR